MKLAKDKTAAAIALILMLTITATFITCLPVVNAADVPTYAFLAVAPNPVGVGQTVQVSVWVSPVPPSYPDVMHGFTVTITKPDGTTETKGPLTAFLMGAQFFTYTPNAVGNYTFQFSYPGETFSSTGDVWLPSESPPTRLVVQQDPIQGLPEPPLPTEYWTRPINSENRNWASISGNWLMANYRSLTTLSTVTLPAASTRIAKHQDPHM
jgi:hypothetical protein